jgi:hypothetical protein
MDLNVLIQLATLLSVIAAVVGLIISIRAYKRQVSALFLLEYTKRVDDIMRTLPPNLWAPHLYPQEELAEPNEELRLHAIRCRWRVLPLRGKNTTAGRRKTKSCARASG